MERVHASFSVELFKRHSLEEIQPQKINIEPHVAYRNEITWTILGFCEEGVEQGGRALTLTSMFAVKYSSAASWIKILSSTKLQCAPVGKNWHPVS